MSDALTWAVAHGLSARVLETWSGFVRKTSRVLVPVSLDALVVRSVGGTWADCRMREPAGETAPASEVLSPLFADRTPRQRGVYLHWALPDALTHGVQDKSESTGAGTSFPPVPDRWLVVRLSPGASGARAVRGWMLLAGGAVALQSPLEGWIEPGPSTTGLEQPLTALGHGDPGWAAYYDNVENRLAFHDPLDGVPSGPLAYMVCGWHADPANDPLGEERVSSPVALSSRLKALRWSVPGLDLPGATGDVARREATAAAIGLAGTAGVAWPRLSLYHGAAVGLGWPTDSGLVGDEQGGPPPAQAIRVAVGATTAEAVAALLTLGSDADEARLVEAFHLGMLDELDRPDGRARLDARLHAAGFASYPGGEVVEKVWRPAAPASLKPATAPAVRVEPLAVMHDRSPLVVRETLVGAGRLRAVLEGIATPPAPPQTGTGRWVDVTVPLPRFFAPTDPVVLLEGARRSFRHGGDGRFAADGALACRVTGQVVTALSTRSSNAVRREDLLERGLESGSIPPECEDLLGELALLDPGSASVASVRTAPAATPAARKELAHRLVVEQTAWWAMRDRNVDPAPLLVRSGLHGHLPSPLAVTPPQRPWTPLHLDWSAEYWPADPANVADLGLGPLDLTLGVAPPAAAPGGAPVVQGRTRLTAGAVDIATSAARVTVASAVVAGSAAKPDPGVRPRFASALAADIVAALARTPGAELGDVASALEGLDLVGGSLDPLVTELRGGVPGDGASGEGTAPPEGFVPFAAGWLRLTRLRLVDCFGQTVELSGTPATWSGSMAVSGRPELGLLAPRFTAPARLTLRYTDGAGGPDDARHDVSPLCGFLMPNHLDGSLELFGAAGENVGSLRPDGDRVQWESAPGRPAIFGRAPERSIANPFLAGLARGLVDWGDADVGQAREGALAAFLRVVDTLLWSVDPYASTGEEHLALLVGHPIAVLRARARLEVNDPLVTRWPEALRVPCRLGAIELWQDGLLGFYVGDDYRCLVCPSPALRLAREVGPGRGFLQSADRASTYLAEAASDLGGGGDGATPATHPILDPGGLIYLRPGEEVRLTLLVEPNALVHVTTGLLPRKEIALRREWIAPALARLAPAFRFGPLLVDPQRVRMPVAAEVGGGWSWDHRREVATWARAAITRDTGDALLSPDPVRGTEGWLRLFPDEGGDD